jgi:flagellar hook-length control protein FliK
MVSAMLAPVAAPANTRAAPSQAVACDADRADKGFASALDQAQAPARAKPEVATKGGAKANANTSAKADSKGNSQADPKAQTTTDVNPPTTNTHGGQQVGEPDGRADEPIPVDSAGPSDLAQLLPGWPAPPAATPQGPIAAAPQAPVAGVEGVAMDRGRAGPIAAAPQEPVVGAPQGSAAATPQGPVAAASAATAAGSPADADADANDAQTLRASLAEPVRLDSATTRSPLSMQVPVRGAAQASDPGPALARQPPPAAARDDRKSLKATGHAAAGAEMPPAVPARGGADSALTAVLPLPALAASTAHAAATASTPSASLFEARVAAAVDSPAFAPALASQITWLVREGLQQARFNLNPQEMGPLAVTIVLDGTQARIDFSADMAGTRAAIEASLPTLAAALHDNGLTLAGGGVFDRQSRAGGQGDHGHRAPNQNGGAAAPAPLPAGEPDAATPLRAARGLVDLVA